MDTTHYWPFAREYSLWNAALQFWMADLEPQTLSNAIEWVYTAFCSNSAQQLWNIPEEVLFGHFMSTVNDAFEWKLALEDEGYDGRSESLNIPTPLHKIPCLYHVLASENFTFNPATPLTHWAYSPQWCSSLSSICCHLTFSDDESSSTDSSPLHGRAEIPSPVEQQMVHHCTADSLQDVPSKEEEDFQTAALEDDVWLEERVPDRHLCIHEQSQQHDLCPYPSPYSLDQLCPTPGNAPTPHYEMMDLNDIFNFPDVMTTTSDEDIPDLDGVFGPLIWLE